MPLGWNGGDFTYNVEFWILGREILALSAETRLAEEDVQGSLPGLYKRFGFQLIFAAEEDIYALRSNYRHEDLFLYRVKISRDKVREIFVEFVRRVNKLHTEPEFYNTLTHNCTTGLISSIGKAVPLGRFNPTMILNGFLDRHMFRQNRLQSKEGETFEELKKRSAIPYDFYKDRPDLYSRKIREQVGIIPAGRE